MSIYENLVTYSKTTTYPMHMPGHKRTPEFEMENPYAIDVTEVEGTDNLHYPSGMIRESMDWLKTFYKTRETYMLVNGSTCGILAAISACCGRGDTILLDRNCHKSVYNAIYLWELCPLYLMPEQDEETGISLGVNPKQIEKALQRNAASSEKRISCVVITSPTYEGVISPIGEIAEIVHKWKIPLVVDAAHGAHLAWDDALPQTPMEQGADLVIESVHKTLPAFTQTALLHCCSDRVSIEKVEQYLGIYETSSPSYVLLSGIDICMSWLREHAKEATQKWREHYREFCEKAGSWKNISLWQGKGKEKDTYKFVIVSKHRELSGHKLADMLREIYQIETEMTAGNYVLAMTSFCDSKEGFLRLAEALTKIDKEFVGQEKSEPTWCVPVPQPIYRMSSYEAMNGDGEVLSWTKAIGKIAAEYAYLYPPGIPFLVPGEIITKEVAEYVVLAKEKNLELMGLADEKAATIRVVKKHENED